MKRTLLILIIVFFVCSPHPLFSQQPKQSPAPAKFNVGDFEYTSENRRDPFEPIYLARVKRSREATSLKKGYELEELKLVGILKTDKTKFAMMEDMQGKGVMFKKGDYLNNNLWVSDVVEGRVVLAYKIKNDIKNINIDIPKK
jgi:Tfp pilus assembly protein PilP